MSIGYVIPKTSRFVQTNSAFLAKFNDPTAGKYDFAGPTISGGAPGGYQYANILKMQSNSIYFIERINVGGTIPQEEYLYGISTLPQATFFNAVTQQQVLPQPIPIVNYITNQEVNSFVWTDNDNQQLQLRLSGVLSQTPFLVGLQSVTLNIALNIYDINDNAFVQQFKARNFHSRIGFGGKSMPKMSNSFDVA